MNTIDQIINRRHRGNKGEPIIIPADAKNQRVTPNRITAKPKQKRLAYGLVTLNLLALVVVVGFLISGKNPRVLGAEEQTFTMPGTGAYLANFDDVGYDDWSSSTVVSETEVSLEQAADWWDADWDYRRTITVNNLSGENLAQYTTVQISVNTEALYDESKVKSACEDLRLLYYSGGVHAEITRSYYVASGATNCSDSTATTLTFPLSAAITAGNSDANYQLYYGNTGAADPAVGADGYNINTATVTLACPLNGTTTCIESETPSSATGAIRYTGSKSAISFDGVDDTVDFPDISVGSTYTIEGWFKTKSSNVGYHRLVSTASGGVELIMTPELTLGMFDTNGTVRSSTGTFNDGNWHHLAVVRDGASYYFFVDGVSNTYTNSSPGTGFAWNSQVYYLSSVSGGAADEVRISDVARYTSGFTPQTSPFTSDANTKLLLHFDENGNDPIDVDAAIDSSGNGNDGAITGAKYISGLVGVDNSISTTGSLLTQPYAGHQGMLIEEGTINKITNPSFEHATYNTSWTAGASITATENTTSPYNKFGSKSAKLVAGADDTFVMAINAGNTNNHTLSAYVYDSDTGGTVDATIAKLVFNGSAQTTTYTNTGGGWWRLSYTTAAGSDSQDYGVQVKNGKTIYLDGVQLEEKGFVTTYCDGSLGTGYQWVGDSNNSQSSRTTEKLTYATAGNISDTVGTISLWLKMIDSPSLGNVINIGNGAGGGGASGLGITVQSGQFRYFYGTKDNWSNYPETNKWYHLVLTWNMSDTTARFYINGTLSGDSSNLDQPILGDSIVIGGVPYAWDFFQIDGVISDLRIYDQQLTTATVSDLYYQELVTHQSAAEGSEKYGATGTYTTPALDLGPCAEWSATDDFATTETLNGGTLSYQTSTSANGTDWDAWQDLSGAEIQSEPQRYMKVKTSFASPGDQGNTPLLRGLEINYIPDATAPTNPTTLVTSPGTSNTWFNDSTPSFSWPRAEQEGGATDPGEGASGVKQYHVYFGSDDTAVPYNTVSNKTIVADPGSNDVEYTLGTALTTKGTYYLRIQAEDNAGNYPGNNPEDTWSAFIYKYETINAVAPQYISVNPSGYTKDNQYTFTWPAGTDSDSGVWGYCYKAGAEVETCETKEALLVGEAYQKALSDIAYQAGENIFYVRTKDNAGNYSTAVQTTFYYNPDAPSAPVSVVAHATTGCSGGDDNCWYFTWNEPVDFTEEIVHYYYSINTVPDANSPTVEGDTTQTTSFAAGTKQGANVFYVVAEDVVDVNFGVYGQASFNVDTTAPGIPDDPFIADASNRDTEEWALTVKWSEPADTGSGMDHYNLYRSTNGTDFSKVGEATTTIYSEAALSNTNTYYYKVAAEDNAGAESGLSAAVSAQPTGKYTNPPLFGGTPSADTTAHTASIEWTTDRQAESYVEYGLTTDYELGRVGDGTLTTVHKVVIRGLAAESLFHYRVQSLDDGGIRNYPPEDAYSTDYMFETLVAPDITDLNITDITLSAATISWKTTTISTSEVHYGKTLSYGLIEEETSDSLTTNHTLRLTGLDSGSTYYVKIVGRDADDVEIYSDNYTFTTIAYPRISSLAYEKGEVDGSYGMNLTWESNVPISSTARYYPSEIPTEIQDESTADLETTHTMFIAGLLDNTSYQLQVQGRDAYGNLAASEIVEFTTDIDTRPPIISKLIVETASQGTGNDSKAQIIISWETNEPSTSQVEYGIGVGGENYSNNSPEDSSLNKTHVVVLSDLDTGTPYSVKVLSNDAVGNTAKSGNYTIVTSMPTESALDLILGTLRDNFGWLFNF